MPSKLDFSELERKLARFMRVLQVRNQPVLDLYEQTIPTLAELTQRSKHVTPLSLAFCRQCGEVVGETTWPKEHHAVGVKYCSVVCKNAHAVARAFAPKSDLDHVVVHRTQSKSPSFQNIPCGYTRGGWARSCGRSLAPMPREPLASTDTEAKL